LAAIFAADIAGYSRLMARGEVGTLAQLKACRAIIDQSIEAHRGPVATAVCERPRSMRAVRIRPAMRSCMAPFI
jgi:adenylate cyclase